MVPMMSVSAPSRASASPKNSEALVEPTFIEASTSAAALSTTSPIEIRLTPVLTHDSSVRSFARCSLDLGPALLLWFAVLVARLQDL